MTLKQRQGHQTYNENVDPEQGYNQAKRSHFNSVQEKGNAKSFFQTRKNNDPPSTSVKINDLPNVNNNCTKFQLHPAKT